MQLSGPCHHETLTPPHQCADIPVLVLVPGHHGLQESREDGLLLYGRLQQGPGLEEYPGELGEFLEL